MYFPAMGQRSQLIALHVFPGHGSALAIALHIFPGHGSAFTIALHVFPGRGSTVPLVPSSSPYLHRASDFVSF